MHISFLILVKTQYLIDACQCFILLKTYQEKVNCVSSKKQKIFVNVFHRMINKFSTQSIFASKIVGAKLQS